MTNEDYPYVARSATDPNGDKGGLGFSTLEGAMSHSNLMNDIRHTYPMNWSTEYWKGAPGPWEVVFLGEEA